MREILILPSEETSLERAGRITHSHQHDSALDEGKYARNQVLRQHESQRRVGVMGPSIKHAMVHKHILCQRCALMAEGRGHLN